MQLKYQPKQKAIVLLEDGKIFEGYAAGYSGTTSGEICFNTGMTGYQEVFTDPSYYGQVVVMTNAHIGNYGILPDENESDGIKIFGLIVKKFSEIYSRPSAQLSLQEFLVQNKIVAVSDVDTRALVRYIRSKGAMNVVISSETTDIEQLKQVLLQTPKMAGLELSSKVSTSIAYEIPANSYKYKISVIDYGIKKNILRHLSERGAYLKVFPYNASAEDILSFQPDGIMLSNGPGDPAAMPKQVEVIKQLMNTYIPMFGICLGHQLICEAVGLSTYKMHHGHRGLNHPVKNLLTGKCEITSQNHGFSVSEKDAFNHPDIVVTHVNLNDHTIEGIQHKKQSVFSVQYHP
ncbi:MAG: glutamine-hydrolyzing carbamoyl-phosphate synthase small subunit, partial [Bacteroidia bacterium]|nr:glutamine-hydrolyzing carbamoyl-phosphate synthase small subunit [Bacteroidia bacterium]